jgi:hypothetical protein
MVEDKIELDLDTKPVEFGYVPGGDQFFIDVVINDGKATIQVTVEKGGKDIEE